MPTDPDPLAEIQALLDHPFIKENQAGLQRIEVLLTKNQHARACLDLLQHTARANQYQTVRAKASEILAAWQHKNQVVRQPDDRRHIFGAICPTCGHQNYYDRRVECAKRSTFLGIEPPPHLVECQKCHNWFVIELDCEDSNGH